VHIAEQRLEHRRGACVAHGGQRLHAHPAHGDRSVGGTFGQLAVQSI